MDGPLEVMSRVRSASLGLGSGGVGAFSDPGGPLRGAHVRMARTELDQRGRNSFLAERWATQPVTARARVVWRGWATAFGATLRWEGGAGREVTPRMRERMDELGSLLSGPATRGELRVLEAYEAYFQILFTLGWAAVVRNDPTLDARRLGGAGADGSDEASRDAWQMLVAAWSAPWEARRRHDEIAETLLRWIEPAGAAAIRGAV